MGIFWLESEHCGEVLAGDLSLTADRIQAQVTLRLLLSTVLKIFLNEVEKDWHSAAAHLVSNG